MNNPTIGSGHVIFYETFSKQVPPSNPKIHGLHINPTFHPILLIFRSILDPIFALCPFAILKIDLQENSHVAANFNGTELRGKYPRKNASTIFTSSHVIMTAEYRETRMWQTQMTQRSKFIALVI